MKNFKIKLVKRGLYKRPVYNIVVSRVVNRNTIDSVEILGTYSPNYPNKYAFINVQRLAYWVSAGATLSLSVTRLLNFIYS